MFHGSSGRRLHTLEGREDTIWDLAVLGDTLLASGADDGKLKLWNAATGVCLYTHDFGDGVQVDALCVLSPDTFAFGDKGLDGALSVFSHAGGRVVEQHFQFQAHHKNTLNDICAWGDPVTTASDDKTAAVWSGASRRRLAVLKGHTDPVQSVAINAKHIATGSDDHTIRVYVAESYTLISVLENLHTLWVNCVRLFGNGFVLSCSSTRRFR